MLASIPAHAQPEGKKAASGAERVSLRFEKASTLSGSEQIAKAEDYLSDMKGRLRRGFELLEQARADKDIVKLNCVNEKLASIKGLLKISESAWVALQEAVARRDKETGDHEFTKIDIAHQKVESLAIEAEGCAGESLHYAGDTRVEVIAEGIPDDDPTQGDVEEIIDVTEAAVSPVQ